MKLAAPRRYAWLGRMFALVTLVSASACERASFESLGMLAARSPRESTAGRSTIAQAGTEGEHTADAGLNPAAANNAGTAAAAGGSAGFSGGAGSVTAGTFAAAGSGAEPPGLTGSFGTMPFVAVAAGYVVGRTEEMSSTTTLYLIDSPVTCDAISSFAWLNGLPGSVQVIEVTFPSSASTGTTVTASVVSYAHGGMFSFMKSRASTHSLVLSRNMSLGAVEGTLSATFSSGAVSGAFRAGFCATGMAF
jgi:hypothetical protein